MMVVEAIPGRHVKKGDILVCNQETARVVTPVQAWPVLEVGVPGEYTVAVKVIAAGEHVRIVLSLDDLVLVVR